MYSLFAYLSISWLLPILFLHFLVFCFLFYLSLLAFISFPSLQFVSIPCSSISMFCSSLSSSSIYALFSLPILPFSRLLFLLFLFFIILQFPCSVFPFPRLPSLLCPLPPFSRLSSSFILFHSPISSPSVSCFGRLASRPLPPLLSRPPRLHQGLLSTTKG